MFVENYYKLVRALFAVGTYGGSSVSVTRPNGSTISPFLAATVGASSQDTALLCPRLYAGQNYSRISTAFRVGVSYSYSARFELALGDGDVEPTVDDYTLSGNLITTLSILSDSTKCSLSDNECVQTYEAVIKNTGSAAITIREMALMYLCRYGTSYSNVCYSIMCERTVLEEPITVEASNTATITYKIKTVVPAIPTA